LSFTRPRQGAEPLRSAALAAPLLALRTTPALLFLQMLIATIVIPGIRPLFATYHGGAEGPMHAFMSLNMLGAVIAAPLIGALADRLGRRDSILALLALADGLLLLGIATPLPTALVLALRIFEGGAHVGAATLLLTEAAASGRRGADGRTMGAAGFAIMLAVASGSTIGGLFVGLDARAPFWAGAALALIVAVCSCGRVPATTRPAEARVSVRDALVLLGDRDLWPLLGAAFVARFAVGALVVTLSLYAHKAFDLSDRQVGILFGALTTTFAFGTYPAGRLGDRVARAGLLALGCAVCAAALVALPLVPAALLVPVMVLLGVGSALVFASVLGFVPTGSAPVARGRLVALVNGVGCLGMLLGPAAAGIISAALRDSGDVARGERAVFTVAAVGFVLWLLASARWLVRKLAAR
jgi:MFS family permease